MSIFKQPTSSAKIKATRETQVQALAALEAEQVEVHEALETAVADGKPTDKHLDTLAALSVKISARQKIVNDLDGEFQAALEHEERQRKAETLAAFKSEVKKTAKIVEADYLKILEAMTTALELIDRTGERIEAISAQARAQEIEYRGSTFGESLRALYTMVNNRQYGMTPEKIRELIKDDGESFIRLGERSLSK
jgi:hypothetical protein